jgi:NADPH2:quinone reductase
MKAWRVHEVGEPGAVLRYDEVPAPEPAAGEVIVQVEAAAVNFPDLLLCRGEYHHKPELPFTLGCEAVGRVVAAGADAGVAVGERVLTAPLSYGCFADQVRVPASTVLPVPESMPAATAACLFMGYQTGWVGLHRRAGLRKGETLLVHGAAGGVGSAAVQLGKAAGATVIATAGGARKADACRRLGADVVVDYTRQDIVAAVKEATGGRGADVVYDPVGGSVFEASRRCIAVEGRILVVGFAGGSIPQLPVNHALIKNYSVVGFRMQPFREDPQYTAQVHGELLALCESGAIDPLIDSEPGMSEAPAAVARLGERDVIGRIVLRN